MPRAGAAIDLGRALLLTEVRGFLRRHHSVPVAVFFAVLYGIASLLWGQMLTLFSQPGGTVITIIPSTATGYGWWNYPGLLITGPWGALALPAFPTVAMVLVSVGVGLGMAVAAVLVYRLLRPAPSEVARSKAVGVATGLTPAMLSLLTLGSCCTTTAVATGGVGVLASASGTTTANLLLNNWYLGAAQIAIVWVALFGQELLLTVYSGLLGLRDDRPPASTRAVPLTSRRWLAGAVLRWGLVVGGLLWSLSMLAEWTTRPPAMAGAGWWFQWLVQHQLVAGFAVGSGFFPGAFANLCRAIRRGPLRVVGALLGVSALSMLVWLPPPLPAWGLDSLANELLGTAGFPAAWGAIRVPIGGVSLLARWGLEYLIPAGFLLAAILRPGPTFAPLLAGASSTPTGSESTGSVRGADAHDASRGTAAVAAVTDWP